MVRSFFLLKCQGEIFKIDFWCSFNNVEVKDKGEEVFNKECVAKILLFRASFEGASCFSVQLMICAPQRVCNYCFHN